MDGQKRVAIVGAGPSGLTAARQALQYGCAVSVFEKERTFGGVWRWAVDPDAPRRPVPSHSSTHFSAQLCAFSELPMPLEHPSQHFPRPDDALAYLEQYVQRFGLDAHIRTGTRVCEVRRADTWESTGQWIVRWTRNNDEEEAEEVFDAVMMCTGQRLRQWRPPEYRMEKEFKGRVIHSEQFGHPADFRGQIVCVVGQANSALEIATALASTAKQVLLCTRRGGWLLPRLHQRQSWDWTHHSRWHAVWRQLVPKWVRNVVWEQYADAVLDHWRAGLEPKHRLLSANFSFGADQLGLLLASGHIQIRPNILSLSDSNRVEFTDGTVAEHVDAIILCTGFEFDFRLVEQGKHLRVYYNDFHLYKHMYAPELAPHHHTMAVIGHVQPRGGAIWPIAELQARLFCHVLTGRVRLPDPFWMKAELEKRRCAVSVNMLKTRRHTQTEDFVQFASELAALIGAHPPPLWGTFTKDPDLALALLFGPCCSAQFRLIGTHAQPEEARRTVIQVAEQAGVFSARQWIGPYLWPLIFVILMLIIARLMMA